MWLFTTVGFFSVVQKPGEEALTVRARVSADLDRLRARYLPSLSETRFGAGRDYPYRATAPREDFARAAAAIARDVTYSSFKEAAWDQLGLPHHQAFHEVWEVMRRIEPAAPARRNTRPADRAESA